MRNALLTTTLALLASGCCMGQVCDACPFPIFVYVTDAATGDPLLEADIELDAPSCGSTYWQGDALVIDCPLDEDHALGFTATGYEPGTLTVSADSNDSDGCCACGFDVATFDLTLEPIAADG